MKYLFICLLFSGCASFKGVQMDDAERKACASEGCAVFTERELKELALRFYNQGYRAGVKSL